MPPSFRAGQTVRLSHGERGIVAHRTYPGETTATVLILPPAGPVRELRDLPLNELELEKGSTPPCPTP